MTSQYHPRPLLYNVEFVQRRISYNIIGYLHSFSCCCLPKLRNQAKFRQNLTLQQFKVIQGHRSWCQSKAHMRLSISH